jgi:outer membrane receptor for ferrienterochelin and colicins
VIRSLLIYIFYSLFWFSLCSQSNEIDTLKEAIIEDIVVVTATRSAQTVKELPGSIQIITKKMIQQSGSQVLTDILQQQADLVLANNPVGQALQGFPNPFGSGIQLQGLDPAYTLIMVDGEPLIGRNAGVLNLGRIPIGNIQQIEIVKGPATSLYGSDALAGVINIITERPTKNQGNFQLYRASNNTWGLTGGGTIMSEKTSVQLFGNRFSSSGYDLQSEIYGQTIDPSINLNFQGKVIHKPNKKTELITSLRFYEQQQENNYLINEANQSSAVRGRNNELDWSNNTQLSYQLNENVNLIQRFYINGFQAKSNAFIDRTGDLYDETFASQRMVKPEFQIEIGKNRKGKWISGAGYIDEVIESYRYTESRRLSSFYVFSQKEWLVNPNWTLTTGIRIDDHSLFQTVANPKVATAYKVNDKLNLSFSVGNGFKTPDFRQQFLSFNNSLVGYSLLGAGELNSGLAKLQDQGLISRDLNIGNYQNSVLLPERSVGYNLNVIYKPIKGFTLNVGLFRNDIRNLIERYNLPFTKSNGQSVFSYKNLNQIYTQGFETSVQYAFNKNISAQIGFKYLDSGDKDVINNIKNDKVFARDPQTYETYYVRLQDYGGLFNRNRNTGSLQLNYISNDQSFSSNLRAIYRSRFGFADVNGNAILDDDREYGPSFTSIHLTFTKNFSNGISFQGGIDNLTDYINPIQMPHLPGRTYFFGMSYMFEAKSKTNH